MSGKSARSIVSLRHPEAIRLVAGHGEPAVRCRCHAPCLAPMTSLEIALIAPTAALAGVALQMVGSSWRDRVKERRAAAREQGRAVAEMLAATVDLMGGIQMIQAAYDRSRWRDWLRRIARVWAAVSVSLAGEDRLSHKSC